MVGAGAIFCMANALIKHQVTSKMRESDKQANVNRFWQIFADVLVFISILYLFSILIFRLKEESEEINVCDFGK